MANEFLREFRSKYGRAPRVLHIGNIANNAYLNAKILNRNGFDCDVICYDYYHIMGCPEWEEVDFDGAIADHFRPDWTTVDLKGYERPAWFAQGPREMCIEYLIAKRSGQTTRAVRLWQDLGWANKTRTVGSPPAGGGAEAVKTPRARIQPRVFYHRSRSHAQRLWSRLRTIITRARSRPDAYNLTWSKLQVMADRRGDAGYFLMALVAPFVMIAVAVSRLRPWSRFRTILPSARPRHDAYRLTWSKLQVMADRRGEPGYLLMALAAPFAMIGVAVSRLPEYIGRLVPTAPPKSSAAVPNVERVPEWMTEWPARFRTAFAERADQLTSGDVAPYMWVIPEWKRLFEYYDIVQAYSTDVMLPMLAHKRPYVGFEHGTLRVFTMDDTGVCRLTSLGYHLADHVLITNGDCLDYARRLKVKSYTAMIHPFDDEFMESVAEQREQLRARYGASVLFLCPLRHDWVIKGTDKYIRALPGIVRTIGRNFKVIMTRWGAQVEDSERLAESLGIAELIAWVEPLNRVQLIAHLKSVDVVFDQIALPSFGGTAPQAIAAGQPVIMSYDPESTKWLIPDAAPILTAWSPEQIVESVNRALDPAWRTQYRTAARLWYDTHHSAKQVVYKHSIAYLDASRAAGLLPLVRIPPALTSIPTTNRESYAADRQELQG